ncbi:MAG: hypothetical protein JNK11_18315 [Alphaproteobacteria bacterium]|nr:hypothetical protein [Alphaproteobacteria bacterium]
MASGARQGLWVSMVAAGGAATGLGAIALARGGIMDGAAADPFDVAVGGLALVTMGALWAASILLDAHFDGVERLRSLIVMCRGDGTDRIPVDPSGSGEVVALCGALGALLERQGQRQGDTVQRLSAVLDSVEEGIVVVAESGLVGLANGAARAALGMGSAAVGTSIFDILDDRAFASAIGEAAAAGRAVPVQIATVQGQAISGRLTVLDGHAGAVLTFPGGAGRGLAHDFSVLDRPPPPAGANDATQLAVLPYWILDLETTGLDVRTCRPIAIAALRGHGERLFRAVNVDRLVDPQVPIPAVASRITGIDDAMVAGAPTFAAIGAEVAEGLRGAAIVGHNIGYDLAILARMMAEAGLPWTPPPALDTLQLVAALEPRRTDLNLEVIARDYGIAVVGRHTALGDCLTTGMLFVRLLPRLAERGIRSFGEARAFAATASAVIAKQRAAGW